MMNLKKIDKQTIKMYGWQICGIENGEHVYIHDRREYIENAFFDEDKYNIFLKILDGDNAIISKEYLNGDIKIIFNGLLEYEEDFINIMRMLENNIHIRFKIPDEDELKKLNNKEKSLGEKEYYKIRDIFSKKNFLMKT